jgi:hypothetical protein
MLARSADRIRFCPLSLGERGRYGDGNAIRCPCSWLPPLPMGEGRGEGGPSRVRVQAPLTLTLSRRERG